jgi:hypothetical protein
MQDRKNYVYFYCLMSHDPPVVLFFNDCRRACILTRLEFGGVALNRIGLMLWLSAVLLWSSFCQESRYNIVKGEEEKKKKVSIVTGVCAFEGQLCDSTSVQLHHYEHNLLLPQQHYGSSNAMMMKRQNGESAGAGRKWKRSINYYRWYVSFEGEIYFWINYRCGTVLDVALRHLFIEKATVVHIFELW